MVVLLIVDWLRFGIVEMLTSFEAWERNVGVAWGCAPLVVCLLLIGLSKTGTLQRYLFSTAYADFKRGQSLQSDLQTVKSRLDLQSSSNFGPNHPLTRTDHWLSHWGGKLWSGLGFLRCWAWALIYPIVMLLGCWLATGNGSLGEAVFLADSVWWIRLWQFTGIVGVPVFIYCMFYYMSHVSTNEVQDSKVFDRHLPIFKQYILEKSWRVWTFRFSVQILLAIIFYFCIFGLSNAFMDVHNYRVGVGVSGILTAGILVAVAMLFPTYSGAYAGYGAIVAAIFWLLRQDYEVGSLFITLSLVIFGSFIAFIFHIALRLPRRPSVALLGFFMGSLYLVVISAMPQFSAIPKLQGGFGLRIDEPAFLLLFFVGVAPLLNGLSDWLSINITRSLLTRYKVQTRQGRIWGWAFHAADISSALMLTVTLYALLLGLLWLMALWGWQINLYAIVYQLHHNPWSGTSQWLLFMAITNLLPTVLHLGLWLLGRLRSIDSSMVHDLNDEIAKLEMRQPVLTPIPIDSQLVGDSNAQLFVYVLKVQPWLERFTVGSLAVASATLLTFAVPVAAGWLLPYFS